MFKHRLHLISHIDDMCLVLSLSFTILFKPIHPNIRYRKNYHVITYSCSLGYCIGSWLFFLCVYFMVTQSVFIIRKHFIKLTQHVDYTNNVVSRYSSMYLSDIILLVMCRICAFRSFNPIIDGNFWS